MSFFSIIFTLFHLVLFGSMFGSTNISALSSYGGNFISYILIGSIGWGFLWSIMGATSQSLNSEMMMGTLESVLLTSTKLYTLMISYAIFGCLFGLATIAILMTVGYFMFSISVFANATIFTLIVFILSTMMMGFGLIFGGLTMWLKNIGETILLLQNIAMFFCGVYFPISVLPSYIKPLANIMPFYYSIEGLRLSLIPTTPTYKMVEFIVILLALSVLFIVIGLITLHLGLIKAKKDGTLAFY